MATLTKRPNKNGSVSWLIRVSSGKDIATGKYQRVSISFTGNKKQAEIKAKELQLKADKGELKESSWENLSSLAEKFILKKKLEVSILTHDRYQRLYKNHIKRSLGKLNIQDITPQIVEDYFLKLQKKKTSNGTLRMIHKFLKPLLAYAVNLELINRNPMELMKAPKKVNPDLNIPSVEDVKIIIDKNLKKKYYWAYIGSSIAVSTGMRLAEIVGLKWSDIDFEKRRISVQRSWINSDSGKVIGETKNKYSRRSITIGKKLLKVLTEYKELRSDMKSDWIFVNDIDDQDYPYNPQSLSQAWRRACKESGYQNIRFHDLRHFHAVNLLRNGVSIKQISSRLGHSSSIITMDVYMRYLPQEMEYEVADVTDNFLF